STGPCYQLLILALYLCPRSLTH
ncbi:peptidyl-prolyl cis-trans isomerase A-like, partial [Daubentonia madagascariensis]